MEMNDFGDNDVEMHEDQDEDDKNGHYFCPITHELMVDPVMTDDGQSYERAAIEEWLKHNDTSPNTGERLPSKKITPNYSLNAAIAQYRKRRDDQNNQKKICLNVSSIMELINKGGGNGKSLDELANELDIKSCDGRNE